MYGVYVVGRGGGGNLCERKGVGVGSRVVSVASRGEGWSCGGVCGILRYMECIIIVGRGVGRVCVCTV